MGEMQFCTISSRAYLPYARALSESLRRHQPDAKLYVLLADDLEHEVVEANEPFVCVRNEELGLDAAELHRMYLIHGSQFLPAVKPFFIDHLISRTGLPTLCVDSDIALLGSLADLGELIAEHGVLLTPHSLTPYPLDGLQPDDTTILSAGAYNAGVMGYGPAGRPFLEFLKSRLRRECVTDLPRMRVNEQRWLDYAPSFLPVHVLRDAGVNVAYWNLHERPLRRVEGRVMAGSAPLRLVHFSGYDPLNPSVLTCFAPEQPRVVLSSEPILGELAAHYGAALLAAGFERQRTIPLPFGMLPGDIPVDDRLRSFYRSAVLSGEAGAGPLPPDGYDVSQRPAFAAWAVAAYRQHGLEAPRWAHVAVEAAAVSPAAAAPTAPSVSGPAAPQSSESTEELIRRLAQSSAAAIANLDERLSALERALTGVAAPVGG